MRFRRARREPYVYRAKDHSGWGNNIEIFNWDQRKVVGWLWRIPVKGDRIIFPRQDGTDLITKVVKVEPCGDPRDMFFATVKEVWS